MSDDSYYQLRKFSEWYKTLVQVAKKEGLSWMISTDPEDHREGYKDGNTPEEELEEQKYAAI